MIFVHELCDELLNIFAKNDETTNFFQSSYKRILSSRGVYLIFNFSKTNFPHENNNASLFSLSFCRIRRFILDFSQAS